MEWYLLQECPSMGWDIYRKYHGNNKVKVNYAGKSQAKTMTVKLPTLYWSDEHACCGF